MHLAQHWILSWFVGEAAGADRRDRRLITAAGVVPDLDVLPYAVEILDGLLLEGLSLSESVRHGFELHRYVHHRYTHGIAFALLTGLLAYALSRWRDTSARQQTRSTAAVALLAFGASLLHILCDVIGSGPTWPVYPFMPFSDWAWTVSWSMTLADWPNLLLLALMFVAARQYGIRKGRTPLEGLSVRADRALVRLLRNEPASDAVAASVDLSREGDRA